MIAKSAATSVSTVSTVRTFDVLLSERAAIQEAFERIVKRCVRRNLPVMTWSWGKAYTETTVITREQYDLLVNPPHIVRRLPMTDSVEIQVDRIALTIDGETPKYAGWTFLAALQHLDGENIVRALPGLECPIEYRNRGPQCDHCRTMRRRNDTYVLRHEDGRTIQVGSTCIKDFLGSHEADSIAARASMLAEMRAIAEGAGEGFGGASSDRVIVDFLSYVAWEMQNRGWTSRTTARDIGGVATADLAWGFLTDLKARASAGAKPTDEHKAQAAAAEVWAESLTDADVEASKGDYLHNLRAAMRVGLVNHRTAGIIGSVIVAHQNAIGKARKERARSEAQSASQHFGEVKKKTSVTARLDFVGGYESMYGYTNVYNFITTEGNVLTWKTSSDQNLSRADVGKTYTVTGTIKKHGEYKGTKQTEFTRCKIVPVNAEDRAA